MRLINADDHQKYSVASPHGDLPHCQVWSLSKQPVSRYRDRWPEQKKIKEKKKEQEKQKQ